MSTCLVPSRIDREDFAVLCRQHSSIAGPAWANETLRDSRETATTVLKGDSARRDPVYAKWVRMGAGSGKLGLPVTEERLAADGRGRVGCFKYGAIWWSQETGAHAVTGPILETWLARGGEMGPLGYP